MMSQNYKMKSHIPKQGHVAPTSRKSQPSCFTQATFFVSTTALQSQLQHDLLRRPLRFSQRLRCATTEQEVIRCPYRDKEDAADTEMFCSEPNAVGLMDNFQIASQSVRNFPDVVIFRLSWDLDSPSSDDIGNLLEYSEQQFHSRDINDLFDCSPEIDREFRDDSRMVTYSLSSIACKTGTNHSTFACNLTSFSCNFEQNLWVARDNSSIIQNGLTWQMIIEKCSRDRCEPLLLMYVNHSLDPVTIESALERAVATIKDDGQLQSSVIAQTANGTYSRIPALKTQYTHCNTAASANDNTRTGIEQMKRSASATDFLEHRNSIDCPPGVAVRVRGMGITKRPVCSNSDRYATVRRANLYKSPSLSVFAETPELQVPSHFANDFNDSALVENIQKVELRMKSDFDGNCGGRATVPGATLPKTSAYHLRLSAWENQRPEDESRSYIDSKAVEKILQGRRGQASVGTVGLRDGRGSRDSGTSSSSSSLNSTGSSHHEIKPALPTCCPKRDLSSKLEVSIQNNPTVYFGVRGDRSSSSSTSSCLSTTSSSFESNQDSGYADGMSSPCSSASIESTTSFIGDGTLRLSSGTDKDQILLQHGASHNSKPQVALKNPLLLSNRSGVNWGELVGQNPGSQLQQKREMRSKEETGEILAHIFDDARKNRMSCPAVSERLTEIKAECIANTARYRQNRMSYEDMLKKQVKMFTMKCQTTAAEVDCDVIIPTDCKMSHTSDIPVANSNNTLKAPETVANSLNHTVQYVGPLPNKNVAFVNFQTKNSGVPDATNLQLTSRFQNNAARNFADKTNLDGGCNVAKPELCTSKKITVNKPPIPPKKNAGNQPIVTVLPKKKSVRFSDSVSLVACEDDVRDHAVSYLQRHNETRVLNSPATTAEVEESSTATDSLSNLSSPLLVSPSEEISTSFCNGEADTTYEIDSDFGDACASTDDSDSEGTIVDDAKGKVRCSLCRKKWVGLSDIYCTDCSFYMARFEQVSAM